MTVGQPAHHQDCNCESDRNWQALVRSNGVQYVDQYSMLTRTLLSTKPSAHCMALATCFSAARRKWGEGLGVSLL